MSAAHLPLVIDIGMYDGADTRHYLETGHRVVAIEANPQLAQRAEKQLAEYVADGRLTVINAAISDTTEDVTLTLSADNLGGSSIFGKEDAAGSFTVRPCRLADIMREHGKPKYVKVDIEGADGIAIRSLTKETRPEYVSFEAGEDAAELLFHLRDIGFRKFRVVDQVSFREFSRVHCLRDRIPLWLARKLGFTEFRCVKRAGHWFASGHSSGPTPWQADGPWRDSAATLRALASQAPSRNLWYDVQAS